MDHIESTEEPQNSGNTINKEPEEPSSQETDIHSTTDIPQEDSFSGDQETNSDSSADTEAVETIHITEEHVKNLGAQMLVLKGNALNQEIAGKSKEFQAKILENAGKRKLKDIGDILYTYSGEVVYDTSGGEPLKLQINGQDGKIQKIIGVGENNSLKCELKMSDNTTVTLEVPRIQVALGQLKAERSKIFSLFSENEQVVLDAWLNTVFDNSDGDFSPSENLESAIERLSESVGKKAEELAKTNPKMKEALDLLSQSRYDELIIQISESDPEEGKKLKQLIDSGDMELGGLLILMIFMGTLSAMGSLTD